MTEDKDNYGISPITAIAPIQRDLNAVMKHAPWSHDPRTATRESLVAVDWGSGEFTTVYGAMRDGKLIYCTPERAEFSQWLERDGLREEK